MSRSNNSTLDEEGSYFNPPFVISVPTRFWIFLISNILSILCSFYVLYHLLFDRTLRQALNNHVIIVLLFIGLIIELIDIPMILRFYRFGDTWQVTPILSLFWSFIDYACITTQIIIFAWATIERHILIFHDKWISTRKKRFFVHYLPLITLLIYYFVYYFLIAFFPFCEVSKFQSPIVGVFSLCAYDNIILSQWDFLCHLIVPIFIIIIFSLALLIRVLWEKSRLIQGIKWRKQRKMIIQLLSISIIYLLFNFPWPFIALCRQANFLVDFGIEIMAYTIFFFYYTIFIFPSVCCGSLPGLRKRLSKLFFCQRRKRIVAPQQ